MHICVHAHSICLCTHLFNKQVEHSLNTILGIALRTLGSGWDKTKCTDVPYMQYCFMHSATVGVSGTAKTDLFQDLNLAPGRFDFKLNFLCPVEFECPVEFQC